ncbi:hypothetical protein FA13DRAFT_318530 [Coprinellus micaceus]|uniref:Uncharacterized protein n=1 Tax=Coprinellus micaceus TaxID=71717 RepID=A0A4Y7TEK1_COPMI|nr:hypothetical protein FA13DRAFT_318530 [Coprinellus micaceus]
MFHPIPERMRKGTRCRTRRPTNSDPSFPKIASKASEGGTNPCGEGKGRAGVDHDSPKRLPISILVVHEENTSSQPPPLVPKYTPTSASTRAQSSPLHLPSPFTPALKRPPLTFNLRHPPFIIHSPHTQPRKGYHPTPTMVSNIKKATSGRVRGGLALPREG